MPRRAEQLPPLSPARSFSKQNDKLELPRTNRPHQLREANAHDYDQIREKAQRPSSSKYPPHQTSRRAKDETEYFVIGCDNVIPRPDKHKCKISSKPSHKTIEKTSKMSVNSGAGKYPQVRPLVTSSDEFLSNKKRAVPQFKKLEHSLDMALKPKSIVMSHKKDGMVSVKPPAAPSVKKSNAEKTESISARGKVSPRGSTSLKSIAPILVRNHTGSLRRERPKSTPKSVSFASRAEEFPFFYHGSSSETDLYASRSNGEQLRCFTKHQTSLARNPSESYSLTSSAPRMGGCDGPVCTPIDDVAIIQSLSKLKLEPQVFNKSSTNTVRIDHSLNESQNKQALSLSSRNKEERINPTHVMHEIGWKPSYQNQAERVENKEIPDREITKTPDSVYSDEPSILGKEHAEGNETSDQLEHAGGIFTDNEDITQGTGEDVEELNHDEHTDNIEETRVSTPQKQQGDITDNPVMTPPTVTGSPTSVEDTGLSQTGLVHEQQAKKRQDPDFQHNIYHQYATDEMTFFPLPKSKPDAMVDPISTKTSYMGQRYATLNGKPLWRPHKATIFFDQQASVSATGNDGIQQNHVENPGGLSASVYASYDHLQLPPDEGLSQYIPEEVFAGSDRRLPKGFHQASGDLGMPGEYDDMWFPSEHKLGTSSALNHEMKQLRKQEIKRRDRVGRFDYGSPGYYSNTRVVFNTHGWFPVSRVGMLRNKYCNVMAQIKRSWYEEWHGDVTKRNAIVKDKVMTMKRLPSLPPIRRHKADDTDRTLWVPTIPPPVTPVDVATREDAIRLANIARSAGSPWNLASWNNPDKSRDSHYSAEARDLYAETTNHILGDVWLNSDTYIEEKIARAQPHVQAPCEKCECRSCCQTANWIHTDGSSRYLGGGSYTPGAQRSSTEFVTSQQSVQNATITPNLEECKKRGMIPEASNVQNQHRDSYTEDEMRHDTDGHQGDLTVQCHQPKEEQKRDDKLDDADQRLFSNEAGDFANEISPKPPLEQNQQNLDEIVSCKASVPKLSKLRTMNAKNDIRPLPLRMGISESAVENVFQNVSADMLGTGRKKNSTRKPLKGMRLGWEIDRLDRAISKTRSATTPRVKGYMY